jgi:AcrR family transcriptional regulator
MLNPARFVDYLEGNAPSAGRRGCRLPQSRSAKDVQDHLFGGTIIIGEDEAMPYSPEQKRDTREKILESARRLFNRKGYSGVSIEEIMSDASLTHGGFYRHFTGKDELYAAAVRQFLCQKTPAAWQKPREPCAVTKPRAQRIVDAYFSREHFDDRDGCCPLLGAASDVQHGGEAVKAAYREVVEQMVKVFEDHLNEPRARDRALALVALCVGGMVLARSVGDPGLADDFRRTAHAEVLRTAGWN